MLLLVTPLYLLEKNIPIPIITLVMGIGELPWALKFVWGGIIDFYHTYGRKKFTVIGTIIGALGFLALALIDQFFSIFFFALFLFIGHAGIGFLDAGADAWAIDITTKDDRGKINASMNIGKSVSGAIGGPVLVIIGITFGYNIAFILTGLVIMSLAIIPLIVKYVDREIEKIEIWPLIKEEFSKKSTKLTTLYFFIAVLNPSLLLTLLVIFAKTVLFWDDIFIALTGIISLIGGIIPGSIIGGMMADKLGRKSTLYIFLTLILIFSTIPMFLINFEVSIVLIWLIIINFSWSAMTAANWALVMDIINPKIGAVQHEIMCSIANFGDMSISAAAGILFILLGFQNLFLLSAIIVIPAIITLYPMKSDKIK
jgi:MFS family permease